ncbi:MAG: hypothetical protein QM484_06585 [Woeseiaceae bacterium]
MIRLLVIISLSLVSAFNLYAKDRLELETTFIKGNKELPQILYVVPWKDIKSTRKKDQQLVLFSFFGDLFEPVNPDKLSHNVMK